MRVAFAVSGITTVYTGGGVARLNYLVFDLYAPIDIAPDAFVETDVADLDLPWERLDKVELLKKA